MKLPFIVTLAVGISAVSSAPAADSTIEKYVTSIKSAQQVKDLVRSALNADCGTGSCVNNNSTEICTVVGALDLQLDSLISNTNFTYTPNPKFTISAPDLQLFKKIWRQCRPTTYQYWNYGSVLHVWYDPEPREDSEIRRSLGLPSNNKTSNDKPTPPATPQETLLAPLEPKVILLDQKSKNNIGLFNDLTRLVRSNGYRCDSISSMHPFMMSRGFTLVCNQFDYKYEIEDKGGQWRVTIK